MISNEMGDYTRKKEVIRYYRYNPVSTMFEWIRHDVCVKKVR